ncbi:hypothetical protein CDAR_598771 [Caerostris darwini]|uniref:Uncharacterized protein n=1 Tax=Caerostris darwini TaxID=1538125 RepID=A0AAV4R4L6_9ARAC|nr:hypothetical protein CDAR_598751 [Caerostris darwini]GIY16564.1 hypothetical protein CDAR_598771 [Caerostris darwini]
MENSMSDLVDKETQIEESKQRNSILKLDKETQIEESKQRNSILKRKKRVVVTPVRRDSNIGNARKRKRDRFKSVGIDNQQPNLRYSRL